MHDCKKMEILIIDYFDGKLNREKLELLRRHLDECDECRTLFESMREVLKAEKSLDSTIPADLHEQVMRSVRWDARVHRLRSRSTRNGVIAAACAVLIIGGAMFGISHMGARSANDAADTAAPEESVEDSYDYKSDAGDVVAEDDSMLDAGTTNGFDQEADQSVSIDVVLENLDPSRSYTFVAGVDTFDYGQYHEQLLDLYELHGWTVIEMDCALYEKLVDNGVLTGIEEYQTDTMSDAESDRVLLILR